MKNWLVTVIAALVFECTCAIAEVKPAPPIRSLFVILDNTQSMRLPAKKESWDGFVRIYNTLPPSAPVTLLLLEGRGFNKEFRAKGKASAIRQQVMKMRTYYLSTEGPGPRESSRLRCSALGEKESRFLDAIRYGVVDEILSDSAGAHRYRYETHVFGDLVEESCDNVLRIRIDMKSDPTLSHLSLSGVVTGGQIPKWPSRLRVHLHILHDPEQPASPKPDDLELGWRKLLPLGGFQGSQQDIVVTKGR